MKKVYIDCDEVYPIFFVDYTPVNEIYKKYAVDIDEETLKRWDEVIAEYNKVQKEMKAISDEQMNKYIKDMTK
jgi:hypothetical protein